LVGQRVIVEQNRQATQDRLQQRLQRVEAAIQDLALDEPALAAYDGGKNGLAGTSLRATGAAKLDARSAQSRAYVKHLRDQQDRFLNDLRGVSRGSVTVGHRYFHVMNGMTLRMSDSQARIAATLPGVRLVEADTALQLETDRGPAFIGAPAVWDGSATGVAAQGEGMVIGIIDSGINHGHPSFAEEGADGYGGAGEYAATNPFGAGGFAGGERDDCPDPELVGLCNNKLIGAYTFLDAQDGGIDPFAPPDDPTSKDTDGHGTHVASTAAGGFVENPPLLDADGNDSGLSLGTVSGVAPHAHIISYKVCAPSCFFSDIGAALDQAILDGVDAVNQSIGSAGPSPWTDTAQNIAFFNARVAGIMNHTSAGNSGPGAGTAARTNSAPWNTTVANSTHDRSFPDKQLRDLAGGENPPADITGAGFTAELTAPVVYAADYPVGAPGDANFDQPEQCLEPFPAGTFNGEIVLCDRGSIARVGKGQNVRDGGAGGMILANTQGGATSTNADVHVIPAIHVNADDGDSLRAWLGSGADHTGTIDAADPPVADPAVGDFLSGSSSRGPFTGFDLLAPHVAAPGSAIYAAGADLQFDHPGQGNDAPSVAAEWGIISGTSMASPHAAGSATLVKQLHPDWTPAEVRSALMTTGQYNMFKETGAPADPFDYGGGRVQVDLAASAGLVMDESADNLEAADPALDGDPSSLNLPGLVDESCFVGCSWTRTVRNVSGETTSWSASGESDSGMAISVTPSSFSLDPGAEQVLEISADTSSGVFGGWNFGRVLLTPSTSDLPEQHLTVAAFFTSGSNPQTLSKSASETIASVGQPVEYTITLNNGSTTSDGPFTLSDPIPDGATYVDGSASVAITSGADIVPVNFDAGTNTINWEGTIDPGFLTVNPDPGGSPFGYLSLVGALGSTPLECSASCDDTDILIEDLPEFTFAGNTYTSISIGTNGYIVAGGEDASTRPNQNMPDPTAPNNVIAAFWTDLDLDGTAPDDTGAGFVYSAVAGASGRTWIIIEYEGAEVWNQPGPTYTFQIWIEIDGSAQAGSIWMVYDELGPIPGALSVGAEDANALLGQTVYFNGDGTAPAAGDELLVQAASNSATLTFTAEMSGNAGDLVFNTANSTGPDGDETASALTEIAFLDMDGDGVEDFADNCLLTPNPSQCDSDGDNFGNHCDADFNNSGFVNFGDLGLLRVGFFGDSEPPDYNELDLDCDGMVNMQDLALFKEQFGTEPGPSGTAD
ncbi:MAG: S8 family serine peptidase, partial [Pseudomonadota bacterium]